MNPAWLVTWSLPLLAVALLTLGCGSGNDAEGDDDCFGASSPGALSGVTLGLDPGNPRYLSLGGDATVLITSGEHYGAVINADFDYLPYLDELARYGFNQTRLFAGSYFSGQEEELLEPLGFANTLAPRPGRFVSPWARTEHGMFDLSAWNPDYFERLQDFVAEAEERGIVVEMTLFSVLYRPEQWEGSPFNPANNVNQVGEIAPAQLFTLENGGLLDFQTAFVREHVRALRSFGNVYFEVINEPFPRLRLTPVTDEWQAHVIDTIERAESEVLLSAERLIARNYDHTTGPITDPHPSVSIHNFHYERDPSRYENLEGVLAFDETGFQGIEDAPYRKDGWHFMLSGGGVYSNLDYSFAPGHEDGSFEPPPDGPGGGGASLRCQLSVLKAFLDRFDLAEMRPHHELVEAVPPRVTTRLLANPGREYAIYLDGDDAEQVTLEAPEGTYEAEWIDTKNGAATEHERVDHAGGRLALIPPPYTEDVALAVERVTEAR